MPNLIQKYISDSKEAFGKEFPFFEAEKYCKDCEIEQTSTKINKRNKLKSFLTSSLNGLADMIAKEVDSKRSFPSKMFQIYEGKMPFAVFEGKADEKEKYQIFKLGFNDAISQVLSLLTEAKEEK